MASVCAQVNMSFLEHLLLDKEVKFLVQLRGMCNNVTCGKLNLVLRKEIIF